MEVDSKEDDNNSSKNKRQYEPDNEDLCPYLESDGKNEELTFEKLTKLNKGTKVNEEELDRVVDANKLDTSENNPDDVHVYSNHWVTNTPHEVRTFINNLMVYIDRAMCSCTESWLIDRINSSRLQDIYSLVENINEKVIGGMDKYDFQHKVSDRIDMACNPMLARTRLVMEVMNHRCVIFIKWDGEVYDKMKATGQFKPMEFAIFVKREKLDKNPNDQIEKFDLICNEMNVLSLKEEKNVQKVDSTGKKKDDMISSQIPDPIVVKPYTTSDASFKTKLETRLATKFLYFNQDDESKIDVLCTLVVFMLTGRTQLIFKKRELDIPDVNPADVIGPEAAEMEEQGLVFDDNDDDQNGAVMNVNEADMDIGEDNLHSSSINDTDINVGNQIHDMFIE